ncbi:MAG: TIGR02757 family protein [bacterium]
MKTELKSFLDAISEKYKHDFLDTDPLSIVHEFRTPADRELVGFIAACFAYGKVAQIKKTVRRIIACMDEEPSIYISSFKPSRERKKFCGIYHRFHTGDDIVCLLFLLHQMINRRGTIEKFFLRGYSEGDENIKGALIEFSRNALSLRLPANVGAGLKPAPTGIRLFFPSPANGSACKRLNLFLRWMVRPDDGIDLGIWKTIPASKLIIPLDTHIARAAIQLGLTKRKSASWLMAEEITENLKRFDPADPVKYDFALTRPGILGAKIFFR